MKQSEPLLPKLPSLGELLKHPTVERVVQRVNQTTVAQRAAGFLDELRTSLRKRDVVPSIHHLAERLARRLLGSGAGEPPQINATGVVCGERSRAPLAQAALDAMLHLASEYRDADPSRLARVEDSLRTLTGAEAAWISHTFDGAVRLAREYAGGHIEIAPYAGLLNPSEWKFASVPTIGERLAGGADVVVADGGGLVGVPNVGIVVGRRESVEKIVACCWAQALAAEDLSLAALGATLDIYSSGKQAIHGIPVLQLLSAPLENLQQRSERLAQLIAALEGVASAVPRAVESTWLEHSDTKLIGPTWVIAVKLQNCAADETLLKWQGASPRLLARTANDEIHLDLRSVFPRWDQQLVTAVENVAAKQ